MRVGLLSLLWIGLAAPAAWAQPAPGRAPLPSDPIAVLLNPNAPPPRDEDEPDTAGQPRTAPEPDIAVLPAGPAPKVYVPAPRTQQDAPVQIDDGSGELWEPANFEGESGGTHTLRFGVEHSINLIKVPDSKKLGEWVGLCKIDRDGNARKVVGCSCVVVKNYGEQTSAIAVLENHFKSR